MQESSHIQNKKNLFIERKALFKITFFILIFLALLFSTKNQTCCLQDKRFIEENCEVEAPREALYSLILNCFERRFINPKHIFPKALSPIILKYLNSSPYSQCQLSHLPDEKNKPFSFSKINEDAFIPCCFITKQPQSLTITHFNVTNNKDVLRYSCNFCLHLWNDKIPLSHSLLLVDKKEHLFIKKFLSKKDSCHFLIQGTPKNLKLKLEDRSNAIILGSKKDNTIVTISNKGNVNLILENNLSYIKFIFSYFFKGEYLPIMYPLQTKLFPHTSGIKTQIKTIQTSLDTILSTFNIVPCYNYQQYTKKQLEINNFIYNGKSHVHQLDDIREFEND